MTDKQRRSEMVIVAVISAYLVGIVVVLGLSRPPWGDEGHHLQTIRFFSEQGIVAASVDYAEMTPPLTFATYAAWGELVGLQLSSLRILSLAISAITLFVFGQLLLRISGNPLHVVVAFGTFLFNPYTIGLSAFIFTDMPMILCLVTVLCGMRLENRPLVIGGMAAGLLVRQYFVFVLIAVAAYYLIRLSEKRAGRDLLLLLGLGVSTLPLAALMVVWQGIAPPSGISYWIIASPIRFHPTSLILYVSLLSLYVVPVYVLRWRAMIFPPTHHAVLLLVGLTYWIFPVTPSAETLLQTSHSTVGLLHRALMGALGDSWLVHVVFYLGFVGGLHFVWWMVRSAYRFIQARAFDFSLVLDFLILAFLLIMPWSYQVWEKYFLSVTPVVLLRLILETGNQSENLDARPTI